MKINKIIIIFICFIALSCNIVFANEDIDSDVASDNSDETMLDQELTEEVKSTLDVLEELYQDKDATIVIELPSDENTADDVKDSEELMQDTCNEESGDVDESAGNDVVDADDVNINTSTPDENGIKISIITNNEQEQQLQDYRQNTYGDKMNPSGKRKIRRWRVSTWCSQRRSLFKSDRLCPVVCRRIKGSVIVSSNLPGKKVARRYCHLARRNAENKSKCCRIRSCRPCRATPAFWR